jgi:hypothetical protein
LWYVQKNAIHNAEQVNRKFSVGWWKWKAACEVGQRVNRRDAAKWAGGFESVGLKPTATFMQSLRDEE